MKKGQLKYMGRQNCRLNKERDLMLFVALHKMRLLKTTPRKNVLTTLSVSMMLLMIMVLIILRRRMIISGELLGGWIFGVGRILVLSLITKNFVFLCLFVFFLLFLCPNFRYADSIIGNGQENFLVIVN